MRKTIIAACAGLLGACSTPPMAPMPPMLEPFAASGAAAPAALAGAGRYAEAIALLEESVRRQPGAEKLGDLGYAYYLGGRLAEAQAALERACLMAPSSALAWERLAALLESIGESGRALEAMRHARILREGAGKAAAPDAVKTPAAEAPNGELWPAGMARVEVRQVSAGLVAVARVAPRAPIQIEVSNGNGVRGMAAAMAQRLRAEGMQVLRLTNTIPFNVAQTRVEIRSSGEPQLRLVLGKDQEIKKPPAESRRQAP